MPLSEGIFINLTLLTRHYYKYKLRDIEKYNCRFSIHEYQKLGY
jgi:hypothetical protein